MEIFGTIHEGVRCLLFDIDNTLYERGSDYFHHGSSREVEEVALILGFGITETRDLFSQVKGEIQKNLQRKIALTEVVYSLGITPKQWSEIRCQAWDPFGWIFKDPQVCLVLQTLAQRYCIHFATNCPVEIGEKIIETIGLRQVLPCSCVFGPENLHSFKPRTDFFSKAAEVLGFSPNQIVSIGDRSFSDIFPAIDAGYAGGILFSHGRDDLLRLTEVLVESAVTTVKGELN